MVVEENNLQVHISTLRKFVGSHQIVTVAGRGYRFTGRMHATPNAGGPTALPESDGFATSASRDIAVLPFANQGGDESQEYFPDGLAEVIVSKLTCSATLYVIVCNSSFTCRNPGKSVADVCCELGARYVVTGSVRRSANKVRISAELVDGPGRRSLWAQRFERPLDGLFDVQNAIAANIGSAIEPIYLRREEALTSAMAPPDMRTWDWLMRRRWHFWRSTRRHVGHAERCANNTLQTTPNDPACLCLLASTHMSRVWAGWADKPKDAIFEAIRLALRAVRQDDTDANA